MAAGNMPSNKIILYIWTEIAVSIFSEGFCQNDSFFHKEFPKAEVELPIHYCACTEYRWKKAGIALFCIKEAIIFCLFLRYLNILKTDMRHYWWHSNIVEVGKKCLILICVCVIVRYKVLTRSSRSAYSSSCWTKMREILLKEEIRISGST